MAPPSRPSSAELALRDFALRYPEAHEDFPWGHRALKVRKRVFCFLATERGLSVTVKLPASRDEALLLPFTEPTGYGLGKSGWVTATFPPGEDPPLGVLRSWIDESYRAIAPKKLVTLLDATPEEPRPTAPGARARRKKP